MSAGFQQDPEPLLAHAAWLGALARRLAADEGEDLVQETWLSALGSRWSDARSPRAFLAGVLRNRWRMARRAESRRREHERARGSSVEPSPSAAEALERAELGRALTDLVLELEEPFRSAILLRFTEGLPPHEIAARLGVPLKTVDSRIQRGIARLRERWRQTQGRDTWLASLLALGGNRGEAVPAALSTSLTPTLGALLVNAKLVLAVLVAAGGGTLFWLARSPRVDAPTAPSVEVAPPAAVPLATPRALVAPPSPTEARTALAPSEPALERAEPPPAAAAEPEPERVLHGRVVDPVARALGGIEVVFEAGEKRRGPATSAVDGRFELAVPLVLGRVLASDPALENLFLCRVRPESTLDALLVVAEHRPLAGHVRDALGRGLPGARVDLVLPADFGTRFDAVLDDIDRAQWSATTDAEGGFALARAPLVPEAVLTAQLEGYLPATLVAPGGPDLALELVLERPAAADAPIAGRVLDPKGRVRQGAFVSVGGRSAVTDAAGEFRLDPREAPAVEMLGTELVAVAPGHLPARYRATLDPESGEPLWPAWVELVLGPAPLAITGRVVDEAGRPRAGLQAWIADPTRLGILGVDTTAQVEFLLSSGGATEGDFSFAYFHSTNTDEEGHFRIEGLLERDYTLAFLDGASLESARFGPFGAGEELELVFARGPLVEVRGRAVSRQGRALPGVQVGLMGATFGGISQWGGQAVTDEEGRFRFEKVGSGTELRLWCTGNEVVPLMHTLELEDLEDELVLTMEPLCHFKVDLAHAPELADRLTVLDGAGGKLVVRQIGASGVLTTDDAELVAGRSVVLGVSDLARTLVLQKDGVEVRRVPLALRPGELTVVTP